MLSALIHTGRGYPAVRLAAQLVRRRSVRHGPLVLVADPLKTPTPTIDRDRTVSRRSEPSSRATLMGEQPNPWDLPRSTFYPLSDGVSMHVRRITMPQFPACSACLPPSQAPLCHCTLKAGYRSARGHLWKPPLRFWRRPPQSNCPPSGVRASTRVRRRTAKGPYFNGGSARAGAPVSLPPAYPTHRTTNASAKLQ